MLDTQCIYIGMTKLKPRDRFILHCSDHSMNFSRIINEIGRNNFSVEQIDRAKDKEEALLKEEFWTVFYKNQNYKLYNKRIANHLTEEEKQKLKERMKGDKNPWRGQHHTEETKRKISESLKGEKAPNFGKHLSDETRRRLSEAHKRYKASEETRRKQSEYRKEHLQGFCKEKIQVQCIETGIIYESMREAARQTGISNIHIGQVCKGKNKTAGGFHWRYVNAA